MSTDYTTSAALKATMGVTVATWDADIAAAITAASRAIDRVCNRRFWLDADASQVRYYTPDRVDVLEIDDLVTLTSLKSAPDGATFDDTWVANTDFVLEPLNAAAEQEPQPYTRARAHPNGSYLFPTYYPRSVQVTGRFGWSSVPQPIVQATTIMAERLVKMAREAPMGVLAFDTEAVRITEADGGLRLLLGPYKRHRKAVA